MVGAGPSWLSIVGDLVHFLCLGLRSRASLAAENLFLRKQLAFYQERKVKPRRADNPTRLTLVLLSRWFNWRDALTVVQAQDLRHVAPQGLPPLLALEVRSWPAADPRRTPTSDSKNGAREPLVGRGADCQRTAAETRSARCRRAPFGSTCRSCRPRRPVDLGATSGGRLFLRITLGRSSRATSASR